MKRKGSKLDRLKRELREARATIKLLQKILQDNTPTFHGYGTQTTNNGHKGTIRFHD